MIFNRISSFNRNENVQPTEGSFQNCLEIEVENYGRSCSDWLLRRGMDSLKCNLAVRLDPEVRYWRGLPSSSRDSLHPLSCTRRKLEAHCTSIESDSGSRGILLIPNGHQAARCPHQWAKGGCFVELCQQSVSSSPGDGLRQRSPTFFVPWTGL